MEGTVKFFDHSKGSGAIIGDDGKEYYVQAMQVDGKISEGDRVSFNPAATDNGLEAMGVKNIEMPDTGKQEKDNTKTEYEEIVEEEEKNS